MSAVDRTKTTLTEALEEAEDPMEQGEEPVVAGDTLAVLVDLVRIPVVAEEGRSTLVLINSASRELTLATAMLSLSSLASNKQFYIFDNLDKFP